MNEDEFVEYLHLRRIVREEYGLSGLADGLPGPWQGAAALVGAAAELTARVFYLVVAEIYRNPSGPEHGDVDGVCAACRMRCGVPRSVANVARFRALIPRLEELSRSSR
jgi:hypothetical protein